MDIRWYIKKLIRDKFSKPKSLEAKGHVCMIHIGRCGSTVLSNMIEQNSSINWAGELYEPMFKAWDLASPNFTQPVKLENSPLSYLNLDMIRCKKSFYGFEIKPYHLKLLGQDPEEFFNALEENGFTKFILLDRSNRLRKIVSSLIAHQTGVYHISPGNIVRTSKRKVFINTDLVEIDHDSKTLIEYLQDYDRQWLSLCDLFNSRNTLSLEYSRDIERGPMVGYGKVARFLDLPLKTPCVYYKRVNPYPLKEIIINYEDIVSLLGETKFSWMLND